MNTKANPAKRGSSLHDGKTMAYQGAMNVREGGSIQPEVRGYKIIEKLGEGGMGTVWRATQQGTKREVALKLMSDAMFFSDRARARFEREVELAARLEHPHIARIYESGLEGGILYYAMELIEGTLLSDYCRNNHLDLQQIMKLMHLVCRAVGYAHRRGVIHRDLKPSNILIDQKGEPKILDFGLAKSLLEQDRDSHVSATGEVFGTPAYMAPEQAAGKPNQVDTRSDVYTLGAILYDLLGGRPPHDFEASYYDRMRAIVEQEPERLRSVNPRVDLDTEAIVYKALAKDQDKRYDNADSMARDIQRYLNREIISARKPTPLYVLSKQIRKHRLTIAMVLGAVAAIAIATASYIQGIQSEQIKTKQEAHNAMVAKQLADDRAEEARKALYGHRIALAYRELQEGSLTRTDDVLEQCPPDLRHFEWYYLRYRNQRKSVYLSGHENEVMVSAMHPFEPLAATGDSKGMVKVWQTEKNDVLFNLKVKGQRDPITRINFSGNGRYLFSSSYDGTVNVWDLEDQTGRVVLRPTRDSRGRLAAFSQDGRLIATANRYGVLRLWSMEDGRKLQEVVPREADVEDLTKQGDSFRELAVEKDIVKDLAFTPDAEKLVTVGFNTAYRSQLKIWNVDDLQQFEMIKGSGDARGFTSLDISTNGNYAVTGEDGSVRVWNLEKKRQAGAYPLFGGPVNSVRFDAAGERFIAAGMDTVRIFDWPRGINVLTLRQKDLLSTSGFDRDGKLFISQGRQSPVPQLWSLPERLNVQAFEDLADTFLVTPDGSRIVYKNLKNEVMIVDAVSQEVVARLNDTYLEHMIETAPPEATARLKDDHIQYLRGIILSPDSRWLATYAWDHNIVFWSLEDGRIHRTLSNNKNLIQAVAFSQQGKQFMSASIDRTLRVWDVESGRDVALILQTVTDVEAVALHHDFDLAAACDPEHRIRIYSTTNGLEVATMPKLSAKVSVMAFSPTERTLASGGGDNLIRLWDIDTGTLLRTLSGHEQPLVKLTFSDDGKRLFSVSSDKAVRLWDPSIGREVLELSSDEEPADDYVVNSDGSSVVVVSGNTLRFWRAPRPDYALEERMDLLDKIDPNRDIFFGRAERQHGGLLTSTDEITKIVPPLRLERDYVFEVTIVPVQNHQSLHIVLPVGRRFLHCLLNKQGENFGGLLDISESQNVKMNLSQFPHPPFRVQDAYTLEVRVKLEGANASVTGVMNHATLFAWSGLVTSLPAHANINTPTQQGGLSIGSHYCSYLLKDMTIQVGRGGAWDLH